MSLKCDLACCQAADPPAPPAPAAAVSGKRCLAKQSNVKPLDVVRINSVKDITYDQCEALCEGNQECAGFVYQKHTRRIECWMYKSTNGVVDVPERENKSFTSCPIDNPCLGRSNIKAPFGPGYAKCGELLTTFGDDESSTYYKAGKKMMNECNLAVCEKRNDLAFTTAPTGHKLEMMVGQAVPPPPPAAAVPPPPPAVAVPPPPPAVAVPPPPPAAAVVCDGDWVPVGQKCLLLVTRPLSFEGATAACSAMGATLATIESEEENEAIGQMIQPKTGDKWGQCKGRTYIGLQLPYDTFDDGTPVTFTSWGPREPSRQGEKCAVYFEWRTWQDVRCGRAFNYLCQKRLASEAEVAELGMLQRVNSALRVALDSLME